MKKSYRTGKYTPRNPDKYVGDLNEITYRSSWELTCFQFFDSNPNILKWASEPFPIQYIKPTDRKLHKYWVDFWVKYKDRHGQIIQEILEIKPMNQIKLQEGRKHSNTTLATHAINMAKWAAAKQWAAAHNITFRLVPGEAIFKQLGT